MQRLTKSALEKHWSETAHAFRPEYREWESVYWDLLSEVSKLAMLLEGQKKLPENCSFLLLSKAVNHALAMISLARRGLCIDAALSCRAAVETLLLLQLLLLDESEELFRQWSAGNEFKPGRVRNELKARSPSAVRKAIVDLPDESHNLNRSIYAWLSEITHANLDSLNHAVRSSGDNSFEVFIGGSLEGKSKLLNALFAITCHGLHLTAIICLAVFAPERLEEQRSRWSSLEKEIDRLARVPNASR